MIPVVAHQANVAHFRSNLDGRWSALHLQVFHHLHRVSIALPSPGGAELAVVALVLVLVPRRLLRKMQSWYGEIDDVAAILMCAEIMADARLIGEQE